MGDDYEVEGSRPRSVGLGFRDLRVLPMLALDPAPLNPENS